MTFSTRSPFPGARHASAVSTHQPSDPAHTCPHCLSNHTAPAQLGRRSGGVVGGVAGAATGAATSWGGAKAGLALGAAAGPVGMALGGLAGALLGGLLGGAVGSTAGSQIGGALDDRLLGNRQCLDCGAVFHSHAS